MPLQNLTDTEREIVCLRAVLASLENLVNPDILKVAGSDPDCSITFDHSAQQQLFNVMLADVLEHMDGDVYGSNVSSLEGVLRVTDSPKLGSNAASTALSASVRAFLDWLDTEVEVDTWLPSINVNARLRMKRREFVRFTGNQSKHNLTRLTRIAKRLARVMRDSGAQVSNQEALCALGDFYERFHDDVLQYHASTIVEFLNNIRWSLHDYLRCEYERALHPVDGEPPSYGFDVPSDVQGPVPRSFYWDLMQATRREPYVRRFVTTRFLKMRY